MNDSPKFKPAWPRIFLESQLARILSTIPQQGRCLNLGCGVAGRHEELLAHFDTDGVDIADPRGRLMPWRFHRCDACALPFADATFDLAIAIESFEHIEDNVTAMREVVRVLKPGGLAIITTPTHWTWPYEFGRHGPHYYTLELLRQLVAAAGLRVRTEIACGGFLFYCANLTKSWLSPFGIRLFGKNWWSVVDHLLMPLYATAYIVDRVLAFPPNNWIVVGEKPPLK